MNRLSTNSWEIAAGLASLVLLAGAGFWWSRRKRPSAEELERGRRKLLVQAGRIVDGMLLDVCEVPAEDGSMLTMLLFSYRIGGVDYECSQDITCLNGIVDAGEIRAGFPCSVRYQMGNPQNSIVVAEGWNGIRMGRPAALPFDRPGRAPSRPVRSHAEEPQPHL
jgi:LPXTG-motif cell wall-anchored protein